MEEVKQRKKYRKRNATLKKVIIFGIGLAYIVMFTYTFFTQSVQSEAIVEGSIERSEMEEAVIIRREKIATSDINGTLYPIIAAGERVAKGENVAVIRSEEADNIENNIEQLNEKLDKLAAPAIFSNDTKLLDNEVNSILLTYMRGEYYKTFHFVDDYKVKINSNLQKKAKIIGDLSPKGSTESNYAAKLSEYEAQMLRAKTELKAPIAGTVVYKLDGFENLLNPQNISQYTADTLKTMNIPKGELVGTVESKGFKIVDNIECFITVVSNTQEALNATVDQKVKIRFPEINKELVTAQIDYINSENNGNVITFRINRGIEDLINYRKVKVEIIWGSESGMKVPSNAILREENGTSIYILAGRNYTVKKKVDVVNEWNGYSIIKANGDEKLRLYDNIVLNVKDINLGKFLVEK